MRRELIAVLGLHGQYGLGGALSGPPLENVALPEWASQSMHAAAQASVVVPLPNGLRLALRSPRQLGCAKFIQKEIFRRGVYTRPGFELRPTDTVIDIGGNVGLFALWAAPQVARVISVEPTNVAECIEESIHLNGIRNVTVVRCAISDRPGTLDLIEYPAFTGITHSAAFQPSRWGQLLIKLLWREKQVAPVKVACPCRTLEEILVEQEIEQVDFLKVDCEGGEYALFDSISDATLAKISRITLEFHELHHSHDYRRIVKRLTSAGFRVNIQRSLLERYLLQTGMLWAQRDHSPVHRRPKQSQRILAPQ